MTAQEKDRIECAINHIKTAVDIDPWAAKIAVDSMEKQIPKPIIIENGFIKCTGCGRYIRLPFIDKYNNCPECGQAINWEGESDG